VTSQMDVNVRALDPISTDVLFRGAHTTYKFSDEPVTDVQLAEIYDLVRYAPSAMNSQPLRITFIRSAEAKARLLPLLSPGNRAKSESAPVVAVLAADTNFHEHLTRTAPQLPNAKAMFTDDDVRERMARFSATIQAGYFILAARAVGLDAGPMGGFDAAAIDAEFFTDTGLRTLLVVNLGTAAEDGQFPRNPRLEFEEAVTIM
jgi:3-hydroxypropanoate dehydrogenase